MSDPTLSEEAREKYAVVADKAIAMTESIKHSIVLLQVTALSEMCLPLTFNTKKGSDLIKAATKVSAGMKLYS